MQLQGEKPPEAPLAVREQLERAVESSASGDGDFAAKRRLASAGRHGAYTSFEVPRLRYLCDPRKRRGSEDEIWRAILDELDKHDDIEFAYPTTRFFDATKE